MIKNREDLRTYLRCDNARYNNAKFPLLRRWLIKDENLWLRHYVWVLRHTEYAINTKSLVRIFWILWHKRLSNKLSVYVHPNVCEPGLKLVHMGGGIYLNAIHIGYNFTATSGVIIGKKDYSNESRPVIGNNVNFTIGSKAIGKIHIGDNCTIAPNTVVIKDIASNSIVSGVPGIIIKTTS